MSEHAHQKAFIQWCKLHERLYPELGLIYHTPNGSKRTPWQQRQAKADGMRAGIPDIHLPVARGDYHGLWIEFKFGKNTLTRAQHDYLMALKDQQHCCEVVYDWGHAKDLVIWYLTGCRGKV
jgi:hypothetical protein